MKKTILITILICGLSYFGNAQLGIQLGANTSTITNNGLDRHIGLNIGATLGLGKNGFQFIPGVLFSQKGAKASYGGTTSKIRINYLEIPLNLSFGFGIGDDNRLLFKAGPYVAVPLFGSIKTGSEKESLEITEDVNPLDLGYNAGIAFRLSSYQIGIDLSKGIVNALQNNQTINGISANHVLSINFTYLLNND